MVKGADLLHKAGAREVYACSTHALLSPQTIERLSNGQFQEVISTNTIPNVAAKIFPELTVLSVANLLAGAIRRSHNDFLSSIYP
ncbi:Ribose-phosphate pyrophosphokinase 1 [Platanthera zijinensis]|uniref:Ribose-phosphate pyrophosphokinase 1 n=1 Tax=Platanthera zijinensis TaxID=2320716 RepID=A0AAP0B454_9ASPA